MTVLELLNQTYAKKRVRVRKGSQVWKGVYESAYGDDDYSVDSVGDMCQLEHAIRADDGTITFVADPCFDVKIEVLDESEGE